MSLAIQKTQSIETITSEILLLKQQTAVNMIEIGKRLTQAKDSLPHGEWGKWLAERVDFSDRTAQRIMQVAREFSNTSALTGLSPTKVFALLDLPPEEREEFTQQTHELPSGESKTVDQMSTRQVQEAIKAQKEAEAKAARLEQELAEAKNRPTEIVEKEVMPADYETIKSENKKLREKTFQAESKLIQKEEEEKDRITKAKLNKKALDQEFHFLLGKINVFLKDVSGYVFLANELLNMEPSKAKEHEAALNNLEEWLNQMKNSLPQKGEIINIEGVICQ